MTMRTNRAMPIMRVRATCRVPFGLMPVRAAIATMMTAMTSHESQVMGVMLLSKAIHQQRSKNDAEAMNAYVQLLFIVGPEGLPSDAAAYLERTLENPRLKDILGPVPTN